MKDNLGGQKLEYTRMVKSSRKMGFITRKLSWIFLKTSYFFLGLHFKFHNIGYDNVIHKGTFENGKIVDTIYIGDK